jgi:hypothetical protein
MPYLSSAYKHVYMLRWRHEISAAELESVIDDLAQKRREVGRPLIYVGAASSTVRAPEGAVRRALARFADDAKPYVESVHLALEGEGFQAAINRSVVTAIILLTRQVAYVHRSLAEAFTWIEDYRGIDRGALLEAARADGIVEKGPRDRGPSST